MAARQVHDAGGEHREDREPVQHEDDVDNVLGDAEPQHGHQRGDEDDGDDDAALSLHGQAGH